MQIHEFHKETIMLDQLYVDTERNLYEVTLHWSNNITTKLPLY